MIFLLFIGLVALIIGAELLVRGSSRLALAFGISPLVVGLTVVSMGTSSPELAVSINAALTNHPDLVLGNIIGSNIFNILFILGICAIFAPLVVAQQLVRLDVPIMIGAHLLFLAICMNGIISRWDALLLLVTLIVYVLFIIRKSKSEEALVKREYQEAFGNIPSRNLSTISKELGLVAAGLILCIMGAKWMTDGSVILARELGISELIIGLTIVAIGTGLPEVATSIVATIRGQRDIAIGNVVGSNIFNLLGIIGVAGLLAPNGISVSPSLLRFDLPIAIAASIACLPVFFFGYKIARWEGALFLGYYLAYASYLLLDAQQHDATPLFGMIMLWFVIPLTILTLFIIYYRALRKRIKPS